MSRLPSVKLMVLPVTDPDSFESIAVDDRDALSASTAEFVCGSRRKPSQTLAVALDVDLGVFSYGEQDVDNRPIETCIIDSITLRDSIQTLRRIVDEDADDTAAKLARVDGTAADIVATALRAGAWPQTASAAVEAAAFARALMTAAVRAREGDLGLCWELHGLFAE